MMRVHFACLVTATVIAACGDVKPTFEDAGVDAELPPIDARDVDAPDVPGMVTVTIVRGGAGGGTVTSTPSGIDCGSICTLQFPEGTVVTFSATPVAGSVFSGWGGACTGTISNCSLTLNDDVAINADFAIATYAVTVVPGGNGTGSVTSNPAGITCPGTCTTMVAHGASISLTASPGSGSTFLGWSGAGCSGTGACNLTVTAPVSVNAPFALNNSLVVNHAGTGDGTVTSSPAGINCGTDCSEAYAPGTVVALTAAPATGSTFTGWSGACTGTGACTVTMNMSQSVTATFTLDTYTLTVSRQGTGTGTVTSNPAGITCGTDCVEVFAHGTMVTLTAVAATGSSFTGWSGGGCSGAGTCTVTMTAMTTVTATFAINQHTLMVTKAGTGVGTVTSPGIITCGTDCSESVNHGSVVVLTASVVAGSGSVFGGWSGGACTGTGTCTVTVTAATNVTATFNLTGPGGALDFDGTNDLATLVNAAALNTPNVTVEAWVFVESASGGAAVAMWGNGGLADRYMVRFTLSPAGAPQCTALIAVGGQQTAAAAITLNAWRHVALTYDGTTLRQYQNGAQVATFAVTGALGNTSEPLRLGLENIALGSSTFFNGRIDEVRVWNVARTAAQISASYNRLIAPNTAGLVAYYRFDEVTGQTLVDSTSGLNGVLGATSGAASDDPARIASTAPVTP